MIHAVHLQCCLATHWRVSFWIYLLLTAKLSFKLFELWLTFFSVQSPIKIPTSMEAKYCNTAKILWKAIHLLISNLQNHFCKLSSKSFLKKLQKVRYKIILNLKWYNFKLIVNLAFKLILKVNFVNENNFWNKKKNEIWWEWDVQLCSVLKWVQTLHYQINPKQKLVLK